MTLSARDRAIAAAQIPLHQNAVDPAVEFEPDRLEDAHLAKPEARMKANGSLGLLLTPHWREGDSNRRSPQAK